MVLSASLILPRGAVYLAGEEIHCVVTLANSSNSPSGGCDVDAFDDEDSGHAPSPRPTTPSTPLPPSDRVVVAWASIQIHGLSNVVETKPFRPLPVQPTPSEKDVSSTADLTSFAPNKGEKGRSFFASKPKILCCELPIAEEETIVLEYKEKLPHNLPPSFKGILRMEVIKSFSSDDFMTDAVNLCDTSRVQMSLSLIIFLAFHVY